METKEIKISEFDKRLWLTEAKNKGAVKILVFKDVTDETLFAEYIMLGDNNEEEIKERWNVHSNSFVKEIPCL